MSRLSLEVRLLFPTDSRAVAALLTPALRAVPYSREMSDAEIVEQCFQPAPPTVHESHWLQHQVLGAVQRGRLLGFVDFGVGYDHTALHRIGAPPLGLLRFMALPDMYPLAAHVAQVLLAEVETLWRMEGVRQVRAFSFSTGYPAFQLGAGILPAAWEEHRNQLLRAGYRLVERYACFRRPLRGPLRESLPPSGLELWLDEARASRAYQLFDPEGDRVATARLLLGRVLEPASANPVAYLEGLWVAEDWRHQGIGRWLLRRMVNDAGLLGAREMVAHLSHDNQAAWCLLVHHGFEELPYRGYTLAKILDAETP